MIAQNSSRKKIVLTLVNQTQNKTEMTQVCIIFV